MKARFWQGQYSIGVHLEPETIEEAAQLCKAALDVKAGSGTFQTYVETKDGGKATGLSACINFYPIRGNGRTSQIKRGAR